MERVGPALQETHPQRYPGDTDAARDADAAAARGNSAPHAFCGRPTAPAAAHLIRPLVPQCVSIYSVQ